MKQILLINPFINCIAGHTVKPFASLVDKYPNLKFITLLRDPIKRYLSQFFYSAYRSGDPRTFEQFLQKETIFNKQTRTIAGEDNISLAKEILEQRFLLVGLVEDFDSFLILLKRKLKPFEFKPWYKKRNVTKKLSSQKKDVYENLEKYMPRILENNKLDIELYNYVKNNLYSKEKLNYGSAFEQDVEQFIKQKDNYNNSFIQYFDYLHRKFYYKPIFNLIRLSNQLFK